MGRDSSSFLDIMQQEGVNPLSKQAPRHLRRDQQDPETLRQRRRAARGGETEGLTLEPLPWLHPLDPVSWCKDGVQAGVFRNVRLGNYPIEARLDLARRPPAQARVALQQCISDCNQAGIRLVLIHIGRGGSETSLANQLKTYLAHWLPQFQDVQAFHSAQPQHGGYGALYLLLRKNVAQRQANWEEHQKKR